MPIVTFKISDKHFQGYEVTLDLDYFETMEEICNQVTNTLKTHLELHKFEQLLERLKEKDFHIHVPVGATPKDGPSAGVGMVTSIISAITK